MVRPKRRQQPRRQAAGGRATVAARSAIAIEAPFHDAVEIESVMTNLGSHSDAGLIVMPGTSTLVHRELICALAARFAYRRSTPFAALSPAAACFPTALTRAICFEVRHPTSTAYFGERR